MPRYNQPPTASEMEDPGRPATEGDFHNVIDSLPVSKDVLARLTDSALVNCGGNWDVAIATAFMIADAPQDWYPELFTK